MKKDFHVFFLFALILLFAANAAWAVKDTIQEVVSLKLDNETGEQYVNMIAHEYDDVGIAELSIPKGVTSFKVYDDGGKNDFYGHPTKNTIIMTAPTGYTLQVAGTLRRNNSYADLIVRDGDAESKSLYNTRDHSKDIQIISTNPENGYVDEIMDIGTVVSSGNVMTLFFQTYNFASNVGLDLTVTVYPPKKIAVVGGVTGGSIQSDKSKAAMGEKVTLTVSNAEGYVFKNLVFTDDNNNDEIIDVDFDGGWYSREIAFSMPNTDIHVTPQFSEVVSNPPSITLPATGTVDAYIPVGVNSFKVYDDGGPNKFYNTHADVYLVLNAVPGSRVLVQGPIDVNANTYSSAEIADSLTIYDGYADGLNEPLAQFNGKQTISVASSGNVMTLHLKSFTAVSREGLDLTVSVSVIRNVSLSQANVGGSASIDKAKAMKGETVTVTANPTSANGYVLKGLEIRQGSELLDVPVEVDWYSNKKVHTATFAMPVDADISVKPVFTNSPDEMTSENFYVNMPKTGTKTVNIPDNMVSFKVYDDGGKDGKYSGGADGYLRLNSPKATDYLQVTGGIFIYSNASLSIYEGLYAFDDKRLLEITQSSGSKQDIGTIIGAENLMMINFTSGEYAQTSIGLDLTVTVLPRRTVSLNQADEGGSAKISTQSANKSATVTVTATPSSGYLLKGLEIKGDNGKLLDLAVNAEWTKASFKMPDQNVSVTPVFTKELTAENLYINMPITKGTGAHKSRIQSGVSSFKLYDDGGKDGNYTADSYGWWELSVPKGNRIRVTGTVFTNGEHASLTIYDSNVSLHSDKNKILDQAHSTSTKSTDIGFITSTDSVLTFYFYADENATTKDGLDLTVTVLDATQANSIVLNDVVGGSVKSDKKTAFYGETVTLTTNSKDGYLFKNLEVRDENNKLIHVDMDWPTLDSRRTATFVMPDAPVTVTPVFTDNLTADGGIFVNMKKNETSSVNSSYVESFKVYDNGGASGEYSKNSSDTLTISAGYGHRIEVTGSVQTRGSHAYLEIYDGNISPDNLLVKKSSTNYEIVDIGTVSSSDKKITLVFHSDDYSTQSGLDLTVSFIRIGYAVSVQDASHGSAMCDVTAASYGDIVTLTATPDEGYLLEDVKVNGSVATKIDWDWYSDPTSNTIKFQMPGKDASVQPVFTKTLTAGGKVSSSGASYFKDHFFVKMPTTGTKTVNLLPNMTSFNIYNDNGRTGYYSQNVDGTIVVTAPEGYALHVTGKITTISPDYVTIYDGNIGADKFIDEGKGFITNISLTSTGNKMAFYLYTGTNTKSYGPELEVKLVKNQVVSKFYDNDKWIAFVNGMFGEDGAVNITEEISVDSVVFNREFSQSGFSTIMLPFDVNVSDIEGLRSAIEFNKMSTDGNGKPAVGFWYVWCDEQTQTNLENIAKENGSNTFEHCNDAGYSDGVLHAYTPYMVEMASAKLQFKQKDGVILKVTPEKTEVRGNKGNDDWVFRGTIEKKVWTKEETKDGNVWAYAGQVADVAEYVGQFVMLGAGASAAPLRAYMVKDPQKPQSIAPSPYKPSYVAKSATADAETASIGEMNVVILSRDNNGENGKEPPTVIGKLDVRTGELHLNRTTRTFDLNGRNVGEGKKAKGAYYKSNH